MTLEDWVTNWITMRSAALRPRTLESYRALLRLHIAPCYGRPEAGRTDAEAARHACRRCARGQEPDGGAGVHPPARGAGDALRLRHIAANPMDAVMRPKHRQTRPSRWGPEEIQRYIIGIRGDPHRIAWLLARGDAASGAARSAGCDGQTSTCARACCTCATSGSTAGRRAGGRCSRRRAGAGDALRCPYTGRTARRTRCAGATSFGRRVRGAANAIGALDAAHRRLCAAAGAAAPEAARPQAHDGHAMRCATGRAMRA